MQMDVHMMVNGVSISSMDSAHSLTPTVITLKASLLKVNDTAKVLTTKSPTRLCKKDIGKMINVTAAVYLNGRMEFTGRANGKTIKDMVLVVIEIVTPLPLQGSEWENFKLIQTCFG